MKNKIDLLDVSFVMPCYNESGYISDTIKHLKDIGVKNVIVVDDGSRDNTYSEAIKEGAFVIKNRNSLGFNKSLEKALYEVKTKYIFVTRPEIRFEKDSLLDFLSFGIKGGFSLLFAEPTNRRRTFFKRGLSFRISPFLKKRYGINISEPSFRVLFAGSKLLEKFRSETISSNESIIMELIRITIKNELKLGTYKLEAPSESIWEVSVFSGIMIRFVLHKFKRRKYLNKAFPRLYKESIKNPIIVAVLGYLIIRFIEIIIVYISHLTS